MKNLIGKTVLLERKSEDEKSLDYNSGEYLVINQSPMTIYCVKGEPSVYSLHNLVSFLLEGTRAWNIVKEYTNTKEELKAFIENMQRKITVESTHDKRSWVESVYTSAQQNLNILKHEVGLLEVAPLALIKDSTITIGIRDGKLVVI